jgi:hypothetical protein
MSSPSTPRGSRLVATRVSFGQLRSRTLASEAHESTRCSQPSITTRARRAARPSTRAFITGSPGFSAIPQAEATVCSNNRASPMAASSTSQAPPGYPSSTSAASLSARRVLPAPPGPVRVTRRDLRSRRRRSEIWCSRPTNELSWAGRLFGVATSSHSIHSSPLLLEGGVNPQPLTSVTPHLRPASLPNRSAPT